MWNPIKVRNIGFLKKKVKLILSQISNNTSFELTLRLGDVNVFEKETVQL